LNPRHGHLDRSGAGQHLPRLAIAVADPPAGGRPGPLGGVSRDIGVHLGLQRLRQHPPGVFPHDLIDQRRRGIVATFVASPRQGLRSGCTFSAGVPTRSCLRLDSATGRYTRPGHPQVSNNERHLLSHSKVAAIDWDRHASYVVSKLGYAEECHACYVIHGGRPPKRESRRIMRKHVLFPR
jgi:hypothetical protein